MRATIAMATANSTKQKALMAHSRHDNGSTDIPRSMRSRVFSGDIARKDSTVQTVKTLNSLVGVR